MRTIKTVLHSLAKIRGDEILDHLTLVQVRQEKAQFVMDSVSFEINFSGPRGFRAGFLPPQAPEPGHREGEQRQPRRKQPAKRSGEERSEPKFDK